MAQLLFEHPNFLFEVFNYDLLVVVHPAGKTTQEEGLNHVKIGPLQAWVSFPNSNFKGGSAERILDPPVPD